MQLKYELEDNRGYHGQLIEAYPHAHVTGRAEAGVVQVGVVVLTDSAPNRTRHAVRPPATDAEVTNLFTLQGITRWDPTYPEPPYRLYSTVTIVRRGRICIAAETPLTFGADVFVRFAVDAVGAPNTLLGALRGDDDAGNAVAAPYLAVVESTDARGLAMVEIRLF